MSEVEVVSAFVLFVTVMYTFLSTCREPSLAFGAQDFLPTLLPDIIVAGTLIFLNVSLLMYIICFLITLSVSYLYARVIMAQHYGQQYP
jgi:hypothetical protein